MRIRPPLPVPSMAAGSSRCSATSRRTAGERPATSGAAVSAVCGSGVSEVAAAAGAGFSSSSAGAVTPVSMVATTCPTSTVSPSATRMCNRPACSALTFIVILSVSSTSSGSSTATTAPSGCDHSARKPSVMDSPTSGILTSNAIVACSLLCRRRQSARASRTSSACCSLWIAVEPVAGLALASRPT